MQKKLVLNGKEINLTGDNTIITSNNFNVDTDGKMTCNKAEMNNATINGGNINMEGNDTTPTINIHSGTDYIEMYPMNFVMEYEYGGEIVTNYIQKGGYYVDNGVSSTKVWYDGIVTPTLTQTSLAKSKKNFEKMSNDALKIIKNIDIYKYNLKNENDTDKKHIGFIIGDKYNYSKEVTSIDNKGVDNYSFTSLCCKAIQEQQEQIETLQSKLKEMEAKINEKN